MPRFRFTVRRMMVAVALAAVIVWGAMMWRRSVTLARRADHHRFMAAIFGGRAGADTDLIATTPSTAMPRIKHDQELNRHHSELSRKYESAARYPWLPVAPDPPEPR